MSAETGTLDAQAQARGVHDVAALARKVSGFDAGRYFDAQAQNEYHGALERWPVLARLMGLAPPSAAQEALAPREEGTARTRVPYASEACP